jgi:hypothetical protein
MTLTPQIELSISAWATEAASFQQQMPAEKH